MLVARRDPPFYSGAHDVSPLPGHGLHAAHMAPPQSRFMTALQVIGSVLAIPVGLASGYSIYHANFSTEARCQGLRANIVSMLDKSADASTLRMLVRRDVSTFERSCGSTDPNAVAAFKTLLAGKPAVPVKTARAPAHSQKVVTVKPAPAKTAQEVATAKSAHRDHLSDAQWLAAVQRALANASAVHHEAASSAPPRDGATPPHPLGQLIVPVTVPATLGAASAPAMPSPATVAAVPSPSAVGSHPVPPAPIPEAAPPTKTVAEPARSGFHRLIAKLPLLSYVIGR